jgi:hypothetical protein
MVGVSLGEVARTSVSSARLGVLSAPPCSEVVVDKLGEPLGWAPAVARCGGVDSSRRGLPVAPCVRDSSLLPGWKA